MTRFTIQLLIILLSAPSFLAARKPAPIQPAIQPIAPSQKGIAGTLMDRIEDSTIYFSSPLAETIAAPKPIKTGLQDLKYLGALREAGTYPYFFFSKVKCSNCPEEPQIYVFRPGQKPGKEQITTFVWPGKIFEPKTRALLMESRAFIGNCIKGSTKDVFVVYQKERLDRKNRLQPSVFVAEASDDHLSERLLERNFPKIDQTIKLVRAKQCQEIEGRNRLMLAKPLDLSPRHNDEENDDVNE